jgi:hypothetical protein
MGFWGIDYFDVVRMWWYIFLAMVPAASMVVGRSAVARPQSVLIPEPIPVVQLAGAGERTL